MNNMSMFLSLSVKISFEVFKSRLKVFRPISLLSCECSVTTWLYNNSVVWVRRSTVWNADIAIYCVVIKKISRPNYFLTPHQQLWLKLSTTTVSFLQIFQNQLENNWVQLQNKKHDSHGSVCRAKCFHFRIFALSHVRIRCILSPYLNLHRRSVCFAIFDIILASFCGNCTF